MQHCSTFYIKQDISALQQFTILPMKLVIKLLMQLKHFKRISHLHFSKLKCPYCKYSDLNETCYA